MGFKQRGFGNKCYSLGFVGLSTKIGRYKKRKHETLELRVQTMWGYRQQRNCDAMQDPAEEGKGRNWKIMERKIDHEAKVITKMFGALNPRREAA